MINKTYSPSQVKKYNASPAEWAWSKFLGIKTEYSDETSLVVGNMVEYYLIHKNHNYDLMDNKKVDKEKLSDQYEKALAVIDRYGDQSPTWEYQVKLTWDILWVSWLWYADILNSDTVIDIKTSARQTNPETTSPNMWSGMSTYDEYAFQLWVYMKLSDRSHGQIFEIPKTKSWSVQIFDFYMTKDFDDKRTERTGQRIQEMNALWDRYGYLVE